MLTTASPPDRIHGRSTRAKKVALASLLGVAPFGVPQSASATTIRFPGQFVGVIGGYNTYCLQIDPSGSYLHCGSVNNGHQTKVTQATRDCRSYLWDRVGIYDRNAVTGSKTFLATSSWSTLIVDARNC